MVATTTIDWKKFSRSNNRSIDPYARVVATQSRLIWIEIIAFPLVPSRLHQREPRVVIKKRRERKREENKERKEKKNFSSRYTDHVARSSVFPAELCALLPPSHSLPPSLSLPSPNASHLLPALYIAVYYSGFEGGSFTIA